MTSFPYILDNGFNNFSKGYKQNNSFINMTMLKKLDIWNSISYNIVIIQLIKLQKKHSIA